MAQMHKMEVQTKIECCAEKFYEIFRSKAYLIPMICPDYVKDIKLVQGDWESPGSVRLWTYVSGKCETVKDSIERIDEKTKAITFNMLEGEVTKYYKTYKPTLEVVTVGQSVFAKWAVEYEKQNDSVPHPTIYLEFLANFSKTIDFFLVNH